MRREAGAELGSALSSPSTAPRTPLRSSALILRRPARIGRRRALFSAVAAPFVVPRLGRAQAPGSGRPFMPYGVQSGDMAPDGAIVWSACDRPARLVVEWATEESFRDPKRVEGSLATADTGFTARAAIEGVAPGQTVFWRAAFADPLDARAASEPVLGRFRTAPGAGRDVSFVWGGDTAGQGYGINPDWGGMRIYETMRRTAPDFFVHSGDTVYADNPIPAEIRLGDGTVWRNLVTEAKSKVAETLEEFRGAWRYNLLDESLRRFNAETPMLAQWDDHETVDNWHPDLRLDGDPRYREKSAAVLAARARRAFLEFMPMRPDAAAPGRIYRKIAWGPALDVFLLDMRSYRAANGENRQAAPGPDTAFLGAEQLAWLKRGLKASRATWKAVAADMPLGLVVWDDFRNRRGSEALANGDDGKPLGREHELADLLSFLRRENVRNVAWFTADVHYAATHRYGPERAAFQDFLPFHEFVSGPLNAGGFGPNPLDATFGPQVLFQRTPPSGRFNTAPSEGSALFGHVRIDGRTGAMTVTHRDVEGAVLHATELSPEA